MCCSPWGLKESDMNESLNWTEGMNVRLRLDEKNQLPFTHTHTHTHTLYFGRLRKSQYFREMGYF